MTGLGLHLNERTHRARMSAGVNPGHHQRQNKTPKHQPSLTMASDHGEQFSLVLSSFCGGGLTQGLENAGHAPQL